EGVGFLGASFVVLVFVFLCFRVYKVFTRANDTFSKLFAAACFGFFFIQGVVNIGMNIGLLPVVGVTLPFVSFGGNSLVANFIFLGILSAISISQKKEDVLEIR
ncbi:MAG TPA: FtsW/RodA/SpoVE family cell cycle protein, partial [Patescibacteria group bacterium]|nr:FtsW/RodA/SpoVE family cell cycle protein [Patescibacteria group bacterium]